MPAVIVLKNIFHRFYKMKERREEFKEGKKFAMMLEQFDLEEDFKPLRAIDVELSGIADL